MKLTLFLVFASFCLAFSACAPASNNTANNSTANANATASPSVQNLTATERPQKIKDMMASRGEQDNAAPTLKIVEPAATATVNSSSGPRATLSKTPGRV